MKNHDNVSCSFALSFVHKDDRKRGRVYLANYFLRRFLRMSASEPGHNALWDGIRSTGAHLIQKLRG